MRLARSISLVLLLGGCGDETGPAALLELEGPPYDAARVPWPSDLLRTATGWQLGSVGLSGDPSALSLLTAALAELDGFGVLSPVFFPLAAPLARAPEGRATIVDLTEGDPHYGATESWPLYYREAKRELVALPPPGTVLAEGHRYGCYLDEAPIHPSPTMRDGLVGGGPAADLYAPLRRYLAGRRRPAAATVFTTGHPRATVEALAAKLAASPAPVARLIAHRGEAALGELLGAPATTRPGLGDPAGVVHDAIGHVLHGTIEAPYFLNADPTRPGRIQLDPDGLPRVLATETIPFTLTLPQCSGPSCADLPVVIFQHGLNGNRAAAFAVANTFARAGYATLAADLLWHGSRLPNSSDQLNNITSAAAPDDIGDPSFTSLFQFFNFNGDRTAGVEPFDPRVMRDNLRQALIDLSQLVRLATVGGMADLAAADPTLADLSLDGSHLVYTGTSIGGVLGMQLLALLPDLGAAVVAAAGGGIINPLMVSAPMFANYLQPIFAGVLDSQIALNDDVPVPGAAQRSLVLLQSALEGSDPAVWAPHLAASSKSFIMLQAEHDEIMANQGGDLLAAAANATQVDLPAPLTTTPLASVDLPAAMAPYHGPASTRTIVQLAPATHGLLTHFRDEQQYHGPFPPFQREPRPVRVDNPIEAAQALAVGFFDSYRRGVPVVIDPR